MTPNIDITSSAAVGPFITLQDRPPLGSRKCPPRVEILDRLRLFIEQAGPVARNIDDLNNPTRTRVERRGELDDPQKPGGKLVEKTRRAATNLIADMKWLLRTLEAI